MVIVLWVSSSFLTYAIFSDDSYSKPYFVTYLNTSVFIFYLIPWAKQNGPGWWRKERKDEENSRGEYYPVTQEGEQTGNIPGEEKMGTTQTMRLSAEFCLMWFIVSFYLPLDYFVVVIDIGYNYMYVGKLFLKLLFEVDVRC